MANPLKRRDLPIALVLFIAVGLLSALSIGFVVVANYSIARRSTEALLQDRARMINDTMVARTRDHLRPVAEQVASLSELISKNDLAYGDREKLSIALRSSVVGLKQVSSVAFVDRDLQAVRAFRNRPGLPATVSDWSKDDATKATWRAQSTSRSGSWGGFFFAEPVGQTFLNVWHPVRSRDDFLGYLVAGVSIRELSTFLKEVAADGAMTPFILYGRDAVAAHPDMPVDIGAEHSLNDLQPLPPLENFNDIVLRRIWSSARDYELESALGTGAGVRVISDRQSSNVFIFKELEGYSDQPLLIGVHMLLDEAAFQLEQIWLIPLIGIPVIIIALLTAALLGNAISRSVKDLARTAMHIRHLDVDGAPAIAKGLFRELNESADAINAMLAGLRALETYVPKFLVTRLIDHHGGQEVTSEDREITVMFTDIVGFTQTAQEMSPPELTAFLNHHFEIVGREVEAELGVIDKYIGDAAMAFWGAPEPQADQALRACRAALAIGKALHADNLARIEAGLSPVRIRIGLHKGTATIGNIGGSSRVNYTVVGDTVNVAERIEEISRDIIDAEKDVGILISKAVADNLGDGISVHPIGRHTLKGKTDPTALFEVTATA
jgi:class 3 adenylate cyclase